MKNKILVVLLLVFSLGAKGQIVDSNITLCDALIGTTALESVTSRLAIVDVEYYSTDDELHRGQIVVDSSLVSDIREVFAFIREQKIVVDMVVPIKFDLADGNTSMAGLNNTYGFHYRKMVGGSTLSNHSMGRAIDVNPFNNPYVSGSGKIVPVGAEYDPKGDSRSLTRQSPLVAKFLELGWIWGGSWHSHKDYMHFEKK